jgi:DNA-binding XRE family transcriptional regulator
MSPTISLVTDRPAFESAWREAFSASGLPVRVVHPNGLAAEVVSGMLVVLDAGSSSYDEDELLTAVGLARALGLVSAVALPETPGTSGTSGFGGIEELLEDLCPGLVARTAADVPRIAASLARRADRARAARFEYLTVSPRPNELLALLGDGSAALLSRPIGEEDDGSEVAGITLEGDAQTATLRLSSGRQLLIRASSVGSAPGIAAHTPDLDGAGTVDGARLGARLRELRLAAGLTQAELARRTGIHRPNIARVEAGRHTPSLETLARLASAIGVPTTVVLTPK